MAIIDSAGLFLGDRLGWCSDVSQLHWPRLYSAANNYARLELNYRKIVSKAYANFSKPPSESEFWSMIREYKDNFLLFIYEVDGVFWGQWQTNERYLLGHKNADDRRSPAPPLDAQDAYRKSYLDKKKSKSNTNVELADLLGVVTKRKELLEVVENRSDLSDLPGVAFAGVGVGVGEGEGKNVSKTSSSHPEPSAGAAVKHPDLSIYEAYPRKEGKGAAMTEIKKAVQSLVKGEAPHAPMTKLEAQRFLMRRVLEYARSPVGSQPDKTKIPHPATWFHQKRYDDDQKNWHRLGDQNAGIRPTASVQRSNGNMELLADLIAGETDSGATSGVGGDETGFGFEGDDCTVLEATLSHAD